MWELSTRSHKRAGITRPIWLMPILESALGIENAFAIATASDRIAGITIGLEDYTADLGVAKTADGSESLYARMRVVNAAHAAHVQAIDSVYGDVADTDGLLRWGEASRAMGFEGMGCIHPIADRDHPSRLCSHSVRAGEGAEDRRGLRRRAGPRAGRGEPRLQDD